jgi:hypothetical protein
VSAKTISTDFIWVVPEPVPVKILGTTSGTGSQVVPKWFPVGTGIIIYLGLSCLYGGSHSGTDKITWDSGSRRRRGRGTLRGNRSPELHAQSGGASCP